LCIYILVSSQTLHHRPRMNHLRANNIHNITLDVRISCDTFWDYSFNIPIRISDYYTSNERNIANGLDNHAHEHRNNLCEHGMMGQSDPMFLRLEDYLIEYVIQHIYDDLTRKRQQRDIPILLKKARKFHIHGRTLEDLLFPNNTAGGRDQMMPENTVYICTHCR
jgi:hypothetical protein